jgi:2-haloacid dehalogenase
MESYLHLKPFPEVQQALEALSHLSLSILSNGNPKLLDAVVDNAGLRGIFTHVISADEVKTYKPAPVAYELAVKKDGRRQGQYRFRFRKFLGWRWRQSVWTSDTLDQPRRRSRRRARHRARCYLEIAHRFG